MPMYRCSVCNRNDGFDATMTTRNGSLQRVDDYWTQQHTKTTPSPKDDSTPYNDAVESLHYSYKSTKYCCAHPSLWYMQYSSDALVHALLNWAATHSDPSRDEELPPKTMTDYTNAHSVMMGLHAGCAPLEGSSSSTEIPLRCLEIPRVLIALSLLQNRYQAAKLELFLNLDPRRAVGELRDLLREYHLYYPLEYESLMA